MAFHHVAITTKDLDATHRFYTEAMGFELVKVEAAPDDRSRAGPGTSSTTPATARCSRSGTSTTPMLDEYGTEISTGLGLPPWANHIAFDSPDLDDLKVRLERWLDNGLDCVRIDHGWCTSIYADDPNGITVEFCASTREFTDDDRAAGQRAARRVEAARSNEPTPEVEFFTAPTRRSRQWTSHPAPAPTS